MTTVIASGDCGNSPKNIFVQNLAIAFARQDTQFLLESATEDFLFHMVGEKTIRGIKEFAESLERMKKDPVAEVTIHHVVTHGKAGAVNGVLKLENGKQLAFCDVVEFGNAKGTSVKEITSYVIEINRI